MTLGFSKVWPKKMEALAGEPTHFQEKILECLLRDHDIPIQKEAWQPYLLDQEVSSYELGSLKPKLHSMRAGLRWRPGLDIHMVTGNRSKNRFQFAPTVLCVSVQKVVIKHFGLPSDYPRLSIDGVYQTHDEIDRLAQNDGFDAIEDFLRYFDEDFKGQIVHWTKLKY